MSAPDPASTAPSPLVTSTARELSNAEPIVITSRLDGSELERVDLIRYAGHYRADSVDAFVVRMPDGRLKVRSESDLGLVDGSSKVAFRAADLGYRPPAA